MKRAHRAAHRRLWLGLAVLIPAILIVSLIIRQDGPFERPAVQIAPPGQ